MSESYTIDTHSAEETKKVAERLGALLEPNDLLTLEGDLGAGKTTFTKGLGTGLGVTRTISSPTFTIVKEYEGRMPLYHLDVYRLEDSDEDIGFDEYFDGGGVCVVEWAQFIEDYLPDNRLDIELFYNNEDERSIHLKPRGERYERICKELVK
ncbi:MULTISPECIES: tRNA (adenosine(37)-N6)-threonylcarbamoyltransferase complex ATPase subunit type 1 TsaE [Pontibacillus]|uniref:tRNA threonylcarbamoyladenosine biosynthesis protein TsaE n=1 Tax=Pontibacillus chungwhensis TaxID=265426 RepID=A0ABY8UYP3_9BACI|nr:MULTISPECIES: tRNA (adenosine(37)-N6)-threonylcarbamoyltransferase complex ATPase subunit type 1 TsaE [Pontibacillus]MCD5325936.1 tRNA (adenosine(37)-N6)-threonylcarbamoyltransferase complex ATPase subunit type 1 TsaE [Pontibacillus sp. HN14]WIF98393.1 tRNA (adenosine(37)-N6)-threonylcarbamoyltransferase complex ATPase subunit type 1 TsaE [Pontibacillus chungwhensis]